MYNKIKFLTIPCRLQEPEKCLNILTFASLQPTVYSILFLLEHINHRIRKKNVLLLYGCMDHLLIFVKSGNTHCRKQLPQSLSLANGIYLKAGDMKQTFSRQTIPDWLNKLRLLSEKAMKCQKPVWFDRNLCLRYLRYLALHWLMMQ